MNEERDLVLRPDESGVLCGVELGLCAVRLDDQFGHILTACHGLHDAPSGESVAA